MADLDMVNRDPNEIHDHLKVSFHDVLGEPDGVHSLDCVWRNSYRCFECGKNCCYTLMTTFCGIFIALAWGCEFALITFQHVWCAGPNLRVCAINMGYLQKFFGSFCNCCLGPICEACGLLFSKVTVYNK